MEEILNRVQRHLELGLPFAIYAKPGSHTLCALFPDDATVHDSDEYGQSGFVFAPFGAGTTCFIPAAGAEVLTAGIDAPEPVPASAAPEPDSKGKAAFEALVATGVEAITAGNFDKLVLSRTEAVPTRSSVSQIYLRLLSAYPQAMRYCFYHPHSGLWMGATPEQLLKAEGSTINTVALAGTQLYKEGQEAVWPEKERQEQQFVTDFILEELQGLTATVAVTDPYTFRAGNIVHIKTDITARLKEGVAVQDVVEKLHPTPAVCGLPKAAARNFIIANEGYDRSYYAGFLGEVSFDAQSGNPGKTDLFVNLRCMKMAEGTAHLFIGCGVTEGSDPEKEYMETVNKSMTMRRVL